jgi:hypothetical protein
VVKNLICSRNKSVFVFPLPGSKSRAAIPKTAFI